MMLGRLRAPAAARALTRSFTFGAQAQRVGDVMTKGVRIIKPNESIQRAAQLMAECDTGFLPVGTGTDPASDRLLGMITDRDIAIRGVAKGLDAKSTKVEACMTRDIKFCYDDEDVSAIAANMQRQHVRRLPVLSRDKKLVGVVSLGDLAVRSTDKEAIAKATQGVSEHTAVHSQTGREMPRG